MRNQYIKWFAKLALFVVVFFCMDLLFGTIINSFKRKAVRINPDSVKTSYLLNDVKTDVVIIGASEVEYSYRPDIISDSLGMSVYNCGRNGQGLYYQIAVVNSILDRYSPKLIVWSIAPNCLTPHESEMDRVSLLKPYYHENKYCKRLIQQRSWYEKFKMLSFFYVYNSEFHSYIFKVLRPEPIKNNYGYVQIEKSSVLPVLEDRQWEDLPENFRVSMFEEVVERLKANEIQTVFVFSPHFSSGDYRDLDSYKLLKSILDKNGFCIMEDYYHYEPLMHDYYFKDKDHLSEEGVFIFSQLIAHDMKQFIE